MSQFIRVINWSKMQHYKDRSPPWIKLHRELLTSETWVSSSNDDRVLAIAIMMLAADTDNLIPASPRYIQRRAYLDTLPDLSGLLALKFIEIIEENTDASKLHANARPEGEGETEGETEQKDDNFDFSGRVIRLTLIDRKRWSRSYPDLDIPALLQSRDDWLAKRPEPERKNWFISTSNWLASKQSAAKQSERQSMEMPIA